MTNVIEQQNIPLISLQLDEQHLPVVTKLLASSNKLIDDNINNSDNSEQISYFVDACHLACPQPLLKIKLALRSVANNDCLYMIATDPNSNHYIVAFTKQKKLSLWRWEHNNVFHFLIKNTK